MRIDFEALNELCIVRLQGRFITGSDAEYLRTRDEVRSAGYRKVLVDFGEVPYIDSTGLNFVVGMYAELRDAGGQFALANVGRRVREVLRITGLAQIIPIFEDRDTALSALRAPHPPPGPQDGMARRMSA